jgi:hypothetical protein
VAAVYLEEANVVKPFLVSLTLPLVSLTSARWV